MVFSDELDPYLGNVYSTNFIIPNSNRFNTSNLALGTVLTYHIKRGTKSRRFHLPIDLDLELGLAVHDFIQRGNSFVNNQTYKSNRKFTYHGSMIWPFSKGKISGGVKHSAVYIEQGNLSTLQVGLAEDVDLSTTFRTFLQTTNDIFDDDFDKFEALYFIFGYQKVFE